MKHAPYTERWSVRLVRERSEAGTVDHVSGPSDIVRLFNAIHSESPVEVVEAYFLNARHRVVGHALVSTGTVDASLITPADVFRPAILGCARAVIVAHNHPSGDPTFSPDDRAIARQLVAAGQILGIALLDFIAVTHDGRYASAAEGGLL